MKQNPYTSMRRLLLTSMILVPFIPFILIMSIWYYYFTTSIETGTIAKMKRIVEDHRQMIDSFLSERVSDMEFVLDSYEFQSLTQPEILANVFVNLQKKSTAFIDLGIFNERGVHVAYEGPYELEGKIYTEAAWFRKVMANNRHISDIFLGFRNVPHFIISIAKESNGQKWIIRATIDSFMFNNLVKKVRIGNTGEAYILNNEGIFQTESRTGSNLMEKASAELDLLTLHSSIKTYLKKDRNRKNYLYATTWLKEKDWMLVVRQEQADAFQALRTALYLIVLITVIGGGAIIFIAFYLTSRIVRRMETIDREKDQLNEQLIRAGRLAELGEMAAGFAHEINNPLQIIRSEETLIETILDEMHKKKEVPESEDLRDIMDSLNQIQIQIDRCSNITQAILKFGRKTEPVTQELNLEDFIPEILEMVSKQAAVQGIFIKLEIMANTPTIKGDPTQLQQVLLNLINNAIDAIIRKHGYEGGELVVGTRPLDSKHVEIYVKDNGAGISPDNLKKIFTPFFTTKPVGKGTGLGLSVCYGIISKMGGEMGVSSDEDIGTTVSIQLKADGSFENIHR